MMANKITDTAESNQTGRSGFAGNFWRCARRGFTGCIYSLILVPFFLTLFLAFLVLTDFLVDSSPMFTSVDVLVYVPGFVTLFLVLGLFLSSMSVPLLVASPVVGVVGGVVGGGVGSLASGKKAIDAGATLGGILLSAIYLLFLISFFETLFLTVS
jgi:hypothetical protein